jgi:hypothetical protein
MLIILLALVKVEGFSENFADFGMPTVLGVICNPQNRNNPSAVYSAARIFLSYQGELPLRVIHLVVFMFLKGKRSRVAPALDFCAKLPESRRENVVMYIQFAFDTIFTQSQTGNPLPELAEFLKKFPIVASAR